MDRTTCVQLDYDRELKRWPIPIVDHNYVSFRLLKLKNEDGSWEQIEPSKYHISKDRITYITWTDKKNPPSNLYAIISTRKIIDNRLIGSLVGAIVTIMVALIALYPKSDDTESSKINLKMKADLEALSTRYEVLKNDSVKLSESFDHQKFKIDSIWQDSINSLNSFWSDRLIKSTKGTMGDRVLALNKELQRCEVELSQLKQSSMDNELDDIAKKELRIRLEYLLGKMFTFQREIGIITIQHNLRSSYGDLFVLVDKLERPKARDFKEYPNFFASARQARDEIFKVIYSFDENLSPRDNIVTSKNNNRNR